MATDRKYGNVTAEKKDLPYDEPVFVLRAQDSEAVATLRFYNDVCAEAGADDVHLAGIQETIETFSNWQTNHVDRVKVPD